MPRWGRAQGPDCRGSATHRPPVSRPRPPGRGSTAGTAARGLGQASRSTCGRPAGATAAITEEVRGGSSSACAVTGPRLPRAPLCSGRAGGNETLESPRGWNGRTTVFAFAAPRQNQGCRPRRWSHARKSPSPADPRCTGAAAGASGRPQRAGPPPRAGPPGLRPPTRLLWLFTSSAVHSCPHG